MTVFNTNTNTSANTSASAASAANITNTAWVLSDLNRRVQNMLRAGVVAEANPITGTCKVRSGELTTPWLPYFIPAAGAVRLYRVPSVGEAALVLSPGGTIDDGFVLCGLHTPTVPPDADILSDETIKINAPTILLVAEEALGITVQGNATVQASGGIALDAAQPIAITSESDVTLRAGGSTAIASTGPITINGESNATIAFAGAATVSVDGNASFDVGGDAAISATGSVEVTGNDLTIGSNNPATPSGNCMATAVKGIPTLCLFNGAPHPGGNASVQVK
ncbi:MAG: phage baseplate assembly protein V [Alphaproteobacteria bacterium]|nr:phage baseplate assembly protein V [Alphaproteobacteria bacterium]